MVSITLDDVWKSFDNVSVLKSVNLKVSKGEFLVILGPSGSGKTTTLKIISGIVRQDKGHVFFDERIVDDIPPWKRNVGYVFQNLALFPHLTVFENIAFGLKVRGLNKSEIEKRVRELVELLDLEGLEDRYPRQLSGGQQQRVAVARALAIYPKILLMDEPFSNLDAILREQLRLEIRKLLKKLGITTIFVTHDQYEAMQLADKIAVMIDGRILQVDKPENLFLKPTDIEVARFLKLNVLRLTNEINRYLREDLVGKASYLVFSSKDVEFSDNDGIPGKIVDKHFVRDYWICEIELEDGQTINVSTNTPPNFQKINVKIKKYVKF